MIRIKEHAIVDVRRKKRDPNNGEEVKQTKKTNCNWNMSSFGLASVEIMLVDCVVDV